MVKVKSISTESSGLMFTSIEPVENISPCFDISGFGDIGFGPVFLLEFLCLFLDLFLCFLCSLVDRADLDLEP